jgi:hypothetical protein
VRTVKLVQFSDHDHEVYRKIAQSLRASASASAS